MKRKIMVTVKKFYDIPENAIPQTKWLLNLMNEYNLNLSKLADIIHVSKQTVGYWIKGHAISFGNICAICYMIDKNSDPEKLYQLFNSSIRI